MRAYSDALTLPLDDGEWDHRSARAMDAPGLEVAALVSHGRRFNLDHRAGLFDDLFDRNDDNSGHPLFNVLQNWLANLQRHDDQHWALPPWVNPGWQRGEHYQPWHPGGGDFTPGINDPGHVAATPEPASLLLLASGAVGLYSSRRRRQAATNPIES